MRIKLLTLGKIKEKGYKHKVDEYIKLNELKKCLNLLEGIKKKSSSN